MELSNVLKTYVTTFEIVEGKDPKFTTKFSYAVDTKVYRWLHQCHRDPYQDKVNDKFIDFTNLTDSVLLNRFVQPLPSPLALLSKKKQKSRDDSNINDDKDAQTDQIRKWVREQDHQNRREITLG